jgi:hypothetical protein
VVQLHALPRHEPAIEAERILIVDFASTQAWAKEVAPPVGRDGGQTEATVTKQLPPLTADEVDKMYYELVKIHSIAAHN